MFTVLLQADPTLEARDTRRDKTWSVDAVKIHELHRKHFSHVIFNAAG